MSISVVFLAVDPVSAQELWQGAKDHAIDDLGVNWYEYEIEPRIVTAIGPELRPPSSSRPQLLVVDCQHRIAEEVIRYFRRRVPKPFIIGVTHIISAKPVGTDVFCDWDRRQLGQALKEGLERHGKGEVPF